MMSRSTSLLAALLLVAMTGCTTPEGFARPRPAMVVKSAAASKPAASTMPAQDIAELKTNFQIIQAQYEELQVRERVLAKELAELKFINDQQDKQIKILSQAPPERDAYKVQVDRLAREVSRLKKLVNQFKPGSEVDEPLPAVAATAPASEPSVLKILIPEPTALAPAATPSPAPTTAPASMPARAALSSSQPSTRPVASRPAATTAPASEDTLKVFRPQTRPQTPKDMHPVSVTQPADAEVVTPIFAPTSRPAGAAGPRPD